MFCVVVCVVVCVVGCVVDTVGRAGSQHVRCVVVCAAGCVPACAAGCVVLAALALPALAVGVASVGGRRCQRWRSALPALAVGGRGGCRRCRRGLLGVGGVACPGGAGGRGWSRGGSAWGVGRCCGPCAPSRLASSVAPSSVAARCSPRPGSWRRFAPLGPARRRVWLRRSLPPRSPLGARPGRGLAALLVSAGPCAPSRLAASVAPSSVAARCSARLRPSGRAGPASLCCGRLATLRPALGLAVPARRRVALRRSLPPCPPLGARACVPLASPAPPGRGCAPSRRPSSVAPSSPAARCSGPCAARPPQADPPRPPATPASPGTASPAAPPLKKPKNQAFFLRV